ncbi:MAG: chitobiase/beta-hexosaminidase C-terminal domain-containing protein, partial [Candidatus Bathyarchaeia archaeon]
AEMRFKNEGGSWSDWQSYTTSPVAWSLPPGDGVKRVYVQFRDYAGLASGETESYDEIALDTTPPAGVVSINAGATYTTSMSVTLTLTYSDATSGVDRVRYSNDGVWDTEPWESPLATKAWDLASGDGLKTVYYEVRDNAGLLSIVYYDDIILTHAYYLTISIEGSGATNPPKGYHQYTPDSEVTIEATPEKVWNFDHWDLNGVTLTDNPLKVKVDKDYTLTAFFIVKPFEFKLSTNSGPPKSRVQVNGSPAPAGDRIEIYWDEVTDLKRIGYTTVKLDNTFTAEVKIPESKLGHHMLYVKDLDTGVTKSTDFNVGRFDFEIYDVGFRVVDEGIEKYEVYVKARNIGDYALRVGSLSCNLVLTGGDGKTLYRFNEVCRVYTGPGGSYAFVFAWQASKAPHQWYNVKATCSAMYQGSSNSYDDCVVSHSVVENSFLRIEPHTGPGVSVIRAKMIGGEELPSIGIKINLKRFMTPSEFVFRPGAVLFDAPERFSFKQHQLVFDHWENSEGVVLSRSFSFTYKMLKPEVIFAVYR